MMRAVAVAALVALVAACQSSGGGTSATARPITATTPTASPSTASPTSPAVYPNASWERDERGDWTALDRELGAQRSTCVAVVQGGRLVHEAYFNGGSSEQPVPIYSITKSLTALLVAMAVDDGFFALDDPASEQVDEWRTGPAGAVTVRHLLSMTSGREWSEATDRTLIRGSTDQTGYAVGLRQVTTPGTEWVYDNAAPQVLERVLAESVVEDGDVVDFAQRRLLGPLGLQHTAWPRDAAGHATTYSGVRSTCLDLARVGHLVLRQGRWRDDRLVSDDAVRQLTTPSQRQNAAYGLLWWTNGEGRVVEARRQAGFTADAPPRQGRLAPHAPPDATWAFGYGNQYVAVVPSRDLVAVRLGRLPTGPDRVTFDSFTAGVLAALE